MLPATVLRLAEVPNIIGIKEATGDIDRAKYLIAHVPEGFAKHMFRDQITFPKKN